MKNKPPSDTTPKSPKDRGGYVVGYGKPPDNSKFQPGKSGNPLGRPRRQPNFAEIIATLMKGKITVTEGGIPKKISAIKALGRKFLHLALKGDKHCMTTVMNIHDQQVSAIKHKQNAPASQNLDNLTPEELDALEKILMSVERR